MKTYRSSRYVAPARSHKHFDFPALKRVCEMHEDDFEAEYEMERVVVHDTWDTDNFYLFKDNGSSILAVAHLDTVVSHEKRRAVLAETEAGDVVYSGALDDRLGAYVLAEMLPSMGLTFDLLFTTGEEMGRSTAEHFVPSKHHDREYNWIIEFDRGGTDVVLYQYEDADLVERVEDTGMIVEQGIFSDIGSMEHIGVKAMNWGVGYEGDYHSTRGHVWTENLFYMVDGFLDFHEAWHDTPLPHRSEHQLWGGNTPSMLLDGEIAYANCEAEHWGIGDCSGEVIGHRELGPLCQRHYHWADDVPGIERG